MKLFHTLKAAIRNQFCFCVQLSSMFAAFANLEIMLSALPNFDRQNS